jgi:ornithine cyclodeaminase
LYSRSAEAAERFAAEMSAQLGLAVQHAGSPSAAIVCTATGSTTPLFDDGDLPPGTHIHAIGSYRPETSYSAAPRVESARLTSLVKFDAAPYSVPLDFCRAIPEPTRLPGAAHE